MKPRYYLLFFLFGTHLLYSQGLSIQEPTFHTPDVAILNKVLDISVNHYTGVPSVSIPLYTVNESSISVPISADYFAGGVAIAQESGVLGLGWALNPGGSISRELRGEPDERYGYPTSVDDYPPASSLKNYLYLRIPISLQDGNATTSLIANLNEPEWINDRTGQPKDYRWIYADQAARDYESDVYSLSIPGFSGKFMFDNDGNIQFLKHNGTIKVEWMPSPTSQDLYAVKWLVTNEQGVEFYFDVATKTSNYSVGYQYGSGSTSNYISSWQLTKIKAPDGSQVQFHYSPETIKSIPTITQTILYNGILDFGFSSSMFGLLKGTQTTTVTNYTYRLDSIVFKSGSVGFTYQRDRLDLIEVNAQKASRLGSIEVKDSDGKRIKKVSFENTTYFETTQNNSHKGYYANQSPVSCWTKRMKLDQIAVYGKEDILPQRHTFTYDSKELPYKSSYAVDHWGYYNGKSNNSFIPSTYIDEDAYGSETLFDVPTLRRGSIGYTSGTKKLGDANRSPDQAYANTAILTKIVYPTGGYKEFEYSVNQENTELFGGLRVDKITTAASDVANPIIRNFTYQGGKLMSMSNYAAGYTAPNTDGVAPTIGTQNEETYRHYYILKLSSSSFVNSSSAAGRVFGYDKVIETLSGGVIGSREYEFINDQPSTMYSQNGNLGSFAGIHFQVQPYPIEESVKNGTLIHYKELDVANVVVKEDVYNYTPSSIDDNPTTKKIYGQLAPILWRRHNVSGSDFRHYYTFVYRINTEWIRLDSKESTVDGVTSTTTYKYDPDTKLLTESETIGSDGNTLLNKTIYPTDILSQQTLTDGTPLYGGMLDIDTYNNKSDLIALNMLVYPIQQETYVKDSNGAVLSKNIQRTTYQRWYDTSDDTILPKSVWSVTGDDTLEERVTYYNYIADGKVQEASMKDGTRMVFIWGYNHTLPVVKIMNATFSDIPTTVYNNIIAASNADDDTCLDSVNCKETLLRNALNALRSESSLSDAMITTYTYDPLVGVTSVTDPRGYTTYYEYDEFNRLKQVKDADGHILSKNNYHYKN